MSTQVQEITNFKTGIDLSLDPILAPTDAFVKLNNGFVHRGVLRSRNGYAQFANGGIGSSEITTSRLARLIENENNGNSANSATQTFTLSDIPIAKNPVTINVADSVLGAKQIVIYYNAVDGSSSFTGDFAAGGSIDWDTGDITVVFDAVLTGGDSILVSYSPDYEDTAVLGIHEFIKSSGVEELVVCDQNYLYTYNNTTNLFQQVPFAGSASAFGNGPENLFVFQNWNALDASGGKGSEVFTDLLIFVDNRNEPFVYDGIDVQLLRDRTEYTAPLEGTLNRALHVFAFGERLIFLRPRIGGKDYGQAVLWGPINDLEGKALDFSGEQSGILSAVTNSVITAAQFVRDVLVVWFESDVFALEITDDAFRPFRWTRLEHNRGIEAPHSSVSFLGRSSAVGRFGILENDGRNVNRSDNKIPFFTRENIDFGSQSVINQIFGTESDENSQFWFAYTDDAGVNTENDKILVQNYEEGNWSIYEFDLHYAETTNLGGGITWDDLPGAWDEAIPVWDKWGILSGRQKLIFGDHHGFIFSYGNTFVDSSVYIRGISQASSAVITTEPCPFQVGDQVFIEDVLGMTEINTSAEDDEQYPQITAISSDRKSVTIDTDSTNYTAYSSGGVLRKIIPFEAEFVPFSPARSSGKRTHLLRMDFLVKCGTGVYSIDFFDDRRTDTWTVPGKTYTFDSSFDDTKRDKWFSIVIDHEADFHRFIIRQNRILEEVAIKSIRVYFKVGGESNN